MWLTCICSLINQLCCCMSVNCIMHLILHLGKKLLCRFCRAVIINGCGIDIRYLLIESTLRQTDLTNLLKQTIKVFCCEHRTAIFQALVIHNPAFDGVVLYDTIGPFTKLHCSFIIYLESNRNNHLKIIMFRITSDLAWSFGLNYSEISNSCRLF